MASQHGKKILYASIDAELFNMYSKLCIDMGITKTDGLIQYFKYLKKQHHNQREGLNERTKSDFRLDARKPQ